MKHGWQKMGVGSADADLARPRREAEGSLRFEGVPIPFGGVGASSTRAYPCFVRGSSFTLIELLVVIAILAILAGLLLPSLRASRDRGRLASCANNLRQVYLGLEMYADDNGEFYPRAIGTGVWESTDDSAIGWMQRIYPYAKGKKIFQCPGQPASGQSDFSYFLGSRAAFVAAGNQFAPFNRKDLLLPAQYILSGDSTYPHFDPTDTDKDNYTQDCLFTWNQSRQRVGAHHAKRVNVLFGDGHVRAFTGFEGSEMTYAYDRAGVDFDLAEGE